MEGRSDLLSRLSAFLPEMEHANADLQKEIAAGRGKSIILDEVDDEDGKEYIEMVFNPSGYAVRIICVGRY